MANQKSVLKIEGTIDELTFYKRGSKFHVRTKGGVKGDRIAKDPAFARTRENGAEFGSCAKSGKALRQAFRSLLLRIKDQSLAGRLTRILNSIKNLDGTSPRGQRNVGVGIETAAAKAMLRGFDFNKNAPLALVLAHSLVPDPVSGVVTVSGFNPLEDLTAPEGATHFAIRMVWAKIDFVNNVADSQPSNVENRALNAPAADIVLTPAQLPQGTGTDVFGVLLEFFQEVNGIQYPLQNGTHNAFTIIEVV